VNADYFSRTLNLAFTWVSGTVGRIPKICCAHVSIAGCASLDSTSYGGLRLEIFGTGSLSRHLYDLLSRKSKIYGVALSKIVTHLSSLSLGAV